ncbi:MAG TPA: pyridoxamine 5'-phosphate oxidase family protein [Acidimicrobiales bacterium]
MVAFFDERTGLETIDRDECLWLLATLDVGRLAIVEGGRPLVFPVNYAMSGEDVVFRTAAGTKLDAADRGPVCFEVDGIDAADRTGWSVCVSGRLEEVTATDRRRLDALRLATVDPWTDAPKEHWMRVVARSITGRRIPRR